MPKGQANKERIAATASRKKQREAVAVASPTPVIDLSELDGAIRAVVSSVNKEHGAGSLNVLGAPGAYEEITHVISTGIPDLDALFGTCSKLTGEFGLPLGKLITIEGQESSGKSTFCKAIAALGQRQGIVPAIHDGEHAGVLEFDAGLGLDLSRALGTQPDTLEDSFKIMETTTKALQEKGVRSLQILDSVASIPTAAEAEVGYDEHARLGLRAAFLSVNLPKLLKVLSANSPVGFMFVNQVRDKIGAKPWERQTYPTGGRALRFYAHIRIELTYAGQIKRGEQVIGIKVRAKSLKNKLAPPYRTAELEIYFNPPMLCGAGQRPRTPV